MRLDKFLWFARLAKTRTLAQAIAHDPELLILDEPGNGLDPQGTREVRTLVRELAADISFALGSLEVSTEQARADAALRVSGAGATDGFLLHLARGYRRALRPAKLCGQLPGFDNNPGGFQQKPRNHAGCRRNRRKPPEATAPRG